MHSRATLALLAVIVLAACGGGGSDSPTGITPVATTSVSMSGNAFVPPSIRVSPGAAVTWTNNDGFAHDVVFSSTAVASIGQFSTGSRTTTMPAAPGTYPYTCTLHAGMNGSVLVQ